MKLRAQEQYAILFVLYVQSAGLGRVKDAARILNLSPHLLVQVALRLKRAGLVKRRAGPGGGYYVVGSPSIGSVLFASGRKQKEHFTSEPINKLSELISASLLYAFNQPVSALGPLRHSEGIEELVYQHPRVDNDTLSEILTGEAQ